MMTTMLALTLLATTAMPPPPGTRPAEPSIQESMGIVSPVFTYDGYYFVPFAEARVRFESHVRGYGWLPERTLVLGNQQGMDNNVALTYTNRTGRLSALLTGVKPRQTTVKYLVESRSGEKEPSLKDIQDLLKKMKSLQELMKQAAKEGPRQ